MVWEEFTERTNVTKAKPSLVILKTRKMQTFLVTGGVGFIGSNFVLKARIEQWANIINLDKLTYASNPQTLAQLQDDSGYHFVRGDIGDIELLRIEQYQPDAIINFAAQSHVERSIKSPQDFIQTLDL
ncbi:dTDP-glucose 4,6-dehydratase [Kalymmatonema gypsitolerans NIES-4073]|nr:dTDP-glucose 4,6-dehydratase [Scytonema sp. NIES-4073]